MEFRVLRILLEGVGDISPGKLRKQEQGQEDKDDADENPLDTVSDHHGDLPADCRVKQR